MIGAALLRPKLTTTKSTSSATHSYGTTHDREHEHIARCASDVVVSEPNAAGMKYCCLIGAYPNAAPFHPAPGNGQLRDKCPHMTTYSSISSAVLRPVLTRALRYVTQQV